MAHAALNATRSENVMRHLISSGKSFSRPKRPVEEDL